MLTYFSIGLSLISLLLVAALIYDMKRLRAQLDLVMNWDEVRANQYRTLSDMVIKTQERRIADLEKKFNDRNGHELEAVRKLRVDFLGLGDKHRDLSNRLHDLKKQYDELAACYLAIQEDRRIEDDANSLVMRMHDNRLEHMEQLWIVLAGGVKLDALRERVNDLYGRDDGVHEGEAQSVDDVSGGVDRQSEIESGRPDLQSRAAEASEEAHVERGSQSVRSSASEQLVATASEEFAGGRKTPVI